MGRRPAGARSLGGMIRVGNGRKRECRPGRRWLATLRIYLPQKKLKLRERSYRELERHLSVHFQPLHHIPLRQVAAGDVSARYLTLANTAGRTTATNAWRSLSALFAWGMRQGLVDRNPCLGVERFPDRKRDRVLSAAEIKAVWDATSGDDDYQCDHSLVAAVRRPRQRNRRAEMGRDLFRSDRAAGRTGETPTGST